MGDVGVGWGVVVRGAHYNTYLHLGGEGRHAFSLIQDASERRC